VSFPRPPWRLGVTQLTAPHRTTLRALSPDTASETTYHARLLGFTPEGGPILQFAEMPRPFDAKSSAVLSTGQDGQVVISFTQDMTVLNTPDKARAGPTAASGPRAVSFDPQITQQPASEKAAESPA